MPTEVRNIRDGTYDPANPQHVYIGRAVPRRGLAASKWANPYRVRREAERRSAIAAYERYLDGAPALRAQVGELRDKTLYCWCAPLLCHGEVLALLTVREAA